MGHETPPEHHAELPETMVLVPWIDPLVEHHGFGPRSEYIERLWLPVLGPTATWLYRNIGLMVLSAPGSAVNVEALFRSMGVTPRRNRNSPGTRALLRLVDFGVAEFEGPETLKVRRALPPLVERRLRQLPDSLRCEHQRIVAATAA